MEPFLGYIWEQTTEGEKTLVSLIVLRKLSDRPDFPELKSPDHAAIMDFLNIELQLLERRGLIRRRKIKRGERFALFSVLLEPMVIRHLENSKPEELETYLETFESLEDKQKEQLRKAVSFVRKIKLSQKGIEWWVNFSKENV